MDWKNIMSWRSKRPRKVLLWLALLLQLLIIGGFCLLQVMHSYQTPFVEDVIQIETLHFSTNNLLQEEGQQQSHVNFIKKGLKNVYMSDNSDGKTSNLIIKNNVNTFKEDFKQLTIIKDMNNNNNKNRTWCFIAGTQQQDEQEQLQCNCLPEWHGRDCSQPEALWRALMTSRQYPINLRREPAEEPTRLIYIIQGNFLNLLLLELQIEAVQHVVDYFIIYYNHNSGNNKIRNNDGQYETIDLKLFKKHLQNIFGTNTKYMLLLCSQEHKKCHADQVFFVLQQQLNSFKINPTDACLMSDDHTILSINTLKYYKYYYASNNLTENSELWRFRLKHNVYGFFWQHPQQTQIAGVLTSCGKFINKNNENENVNNFNLMSKSQQFIVGDLNHFGGWYCEYCQQPEEIITDLLLQAELNNNNNDSNFVLLRANNIANKEIHAADLPTYISHGIYVDSKLQLIKMRRTVDKYFAPTIVLNDTIGKYSNFLLNMYESLDDDLFDDDYINGF